MLFYFGGQNYYVDYSYISLLKVPVIYLAIHILVMSNIPIISLTIYRRALYIAQMVVLWTLVF